MTVQKKTDVQFIGEIEPDRIYRTTLGQEIFGYGQQRIRDLIESAVSSIGFVAFQSLDWCADYQPSDSHETTCRREA
jgi:hypothetical protein